MSNVEFIIKELATELEVFNSKNAILEDLCSQIQASDVFTEEEKGETLRLFEEFQKKRNSKIEEFKIKFDIYQNKVIKLQEKIDIREKVMDNVRTHKLTEFANVFSDGHEALKIELEKSKQEIENAQ
jgi:hypothetical protein